MKYFKCKNDKSLLKINSLKEFAAYSGLSQNPNFTEITKKEFNNIKKNIIWTL